MGDKLSLGDIGFNQKVLGLKETFLRIKILIDQSKFEEIIAIIGFSIDCNLYRIVKDGGTA